ncbi:glutaredoxin-like protein [Burkholderiales bacterium JOSHI_001]|nr:glutaredoxin-like protein [Burkholderiales bacterium JOSHI_001]
MSEQGRSLLVMAALVLGITAVSTWWSGHQESNAGRDLAALARPGDIRMLSSTTCVFCTRARQFMTEHGVAFDECFIERDVACADVYRATAAQGTPTLLVRGQVQLGFAPDRVVKRLQAGPG